eukprot:CAMPEP_0113698928 /NCGR_PEP_ID=MMETSP0038_2-20120614/23002_1 /TAXON_ID=2898 /ORGANISM="Cryptomonas paramecium" /LENGTH=48 /DNA_ID=CAMNT_0000622185 /DNA_START=926 /DNA_END=1072 /DNA_ORIENTATION=+ /assembly_acc=CAM_ASM_000170
MCTLRGDRCALVTWLHVRPFQMSRTALSLMPYLRPTSKDDGLFFIDAI